MKWIIQATQWPEFEPRHVRFQPQLHRTLFILKVIVQFHPGEDFSLKPRPQHQPLPVSLTPDTYFKHVTLFLFTQPPPSQLSWGRPFNGFR